MGISIIAAIGKNGELGYKNKLLWNIQEDMRWFRTNTEHKVVIMGRSTYESIGRPLKNRVNIVLSRDKSYNPHEDVIVEHDLLDAIKRERPPHITELMIIGGGQIYEQALPLADKIYLTKVDKEFKADTFFPKLGNEWETKLTKPGLFNKYFDYSFNILCRKF